MVRYNRPCFFTQPGAQGLQVLITNLWLWWLLTTFKAKRTPLKPVAIQRYITNVIMYRFYSSWHFGFMIDCQWWLWFDSHLWHTVSWWNSPPAALNPREPARRRTGWKSEHWWHCTFLDETMERFVNKFWPGGNCKNGDCEKEFRRPESSLKAETFPSQAGNIWG